MDTRAKRSTEPFRFEFVLSKGGGLSVGAAVFPVASSFLTLSIKNDSRDHIVHIIICGIPV